MLSYYADNVTKFRTDWCIGMANRVLLGSYFPPELSQNVSKHLKFSICCMELP